MAEALKEVADQVAGTVVESLPVCWGKMLRKRLPQMLHGNRVKKVTRDSGLERGQLRYDAASWLGPEFIGLFGAVLCQGRGWTSVTSNQLPILGQGMARGPS